MGIIISYTTWKVSKYGVFSGQYFPLFRLNTVKYGPKKSPYLDTFHAVIYCEIRRGYSDLVWHWYYNLYAQNLYTFSDMTMISYFNITINISIITDLIFSRVLKIFIIFFSHHKFFVKMCFYHFTTILTFFDHNTNKTVNCILP